MSERRVVILKGSPRVQGNSAYLADQVAAGARAAGATVESWEVHSMEIHPCRACEGCHRESNGGECVVQDDMQQLYPRLRAADALVVASPIYCFNVNAQTKLWIDRCYALLGSQGSALAGKEIGIVLTYGDSNLETSGGINAIHSLEDTFRFVDAPIVGIVHGSGHRPGEMAEQPALVEQAYQLGVRLGGGAPAEE